MRIYYYPDHVHHDPGQLHHPAMPERNRYYCEVASRGEIIRKAIESAAVGDIVPPDDFGLDPISEVHDDGMLAVLKSAYAWFSSRGMTEAAIPNTFRIREETAQHRPYSLFGLLGHYCFDIGSPIFENTWNAAYWSAQTALSAAAYVGKGLGITCYALCRPPGHHASSDYFGGFCYLNNAAVAAHWLVQTGQRVAILDIDYHHGNGTQQIFYGRSDVLFCSIHADPLVEYPYFWGYADEYGSGAGMNYSFNYPLPRGIDEGRYMPALESALDRIRGFVPNTLLVSFGADTYTGDPVGGFNLTTASYRRIGERISALELPTVIIQEGGYSLEALGENVVAFLSGILRR